MQEKHMSADAPASIEVFQDLTLWLDGRAQTEVRDALVAQAALPWRHAPEREAAISSGTETEFIAFEREASGDSPKVGLVLWKDPDSFRVTNIVPVDIGELNYQQYNAALRQFSDQTVAPVAARLGLRLDISNDRQSLTDWMSQGTADLLVRFSRLANKSTGSSHPMDRDRWLAFVIAAHKEQSKAADTLKRWLIEVEHWPAEAAWDLVIEYEFGLELLQKYDQHLD